MAIRPYLTPNVFFLKFMTMYTLDEGTPKVVQIIYYTWRCWILFSVFIICPQSILDIFHTEWQEFIQIAINILNVGIYLAAGIRIAYHMTFSNKVRNLVTRMNEDFWPSTRNNFKEISMDTTRKTVHTFTLVWKTNILLSTLLIGLLPLFFMKTIGRTLPIPTWYPWDWKSSPKFELTYFLQVFTNIIMGFGYANTDMFYLSVVAMTVGQIKILSSNFKMYLYVALVKFGVGEDKVVRFRDDLETPSAERNFSVTGSESLFNEICDVIRSDNFQPFLYEEFFECIQYHKLLLSYCSQIEDFFAPIVLPNLAFVVFYIIFISFTLVTTDNASYSIGLIEYILIALGQGFIYTFLGTRLTNECLNVKHSLYESPWYLCDHRFKKTVLFVHKRLDKPVILTAGNFLTLSLTTYVVILKTCASYFAVLRQVTERKTEL